MIAPTKPNSYTYSYYQNDHLGTPQQLLSFNSATVWQGEYDAFGEISITNNQIPQPLRFAGQYHDSESNLYYNWHRYYNPKLGRYISSDPIGLDGGMNRFGYVGGNSLIKMDISGLYYGYPERPGSPNPFGGPHCGSGWNTLVIPDGRFTEACKKHDKCYEICGKPKSQCDIEMCANGACLYSLVLLYLVGQNAYDEAQEKACKQCKP